MRNIWITGSAGFLGTRLAKAFASRGDQVVGLSRREARFATHSVSIDLASDNTCRNLQKVAKQYGPPDIVIHAAARLDKQIGAYAQYVQANVLTTANLLDALNQFPARQIIYTSTLSVYSKPETNPVKEIDPIRYNFPYALTKWWGEQLLEAFQSQAQTIILRLPSLYGVGQVDSFIGGLARLALEHQVIELYARGELVRDVLYIDDVVEAIVSCVTSPPQGGFHRMNLGCGQPITTYEYAHALVDALGSSSKIVPVDQRSPQQFDMYADISQAGRLIDFSPTSLKESMERYTHELRA